MLVATLRRPLLHSTRLTAPPPPSVVGTSAALMSATTSGIKRRLSSSSSSPPLPPSGHGDEDNRPSPASPDGVHAGDETAISLLLPNSLEWTEGEGGRVTVTVRTRLLSGPVPTRQVGPSEIPSGAPGDVALLPPGATGGAVPDSVLRYERQLRKNQAKTRSTAPVNRTDHLRILYEDDHLIVADKPSGVLCVPGLHGKPNLVDLVSEHLLENAASAKAGEPSPRAASRLIVHRLDMDTSGAVVFAKTDASLRGLQAKFRDRADDVVKEYHALVCGHLPHPGGHVHLPLQRDHRHPPFMRVATPRSEEEAHRAVCDLRTHGFRKLVKKRPKPSHTEFRVLGWEHVVPHEEEGGADATTTAAAERRTPLPVTRVLLIPHTGRTHQLRVHMAALGYPILGDPAYGMHGEAHPGGGCDSDGGRGAEDAISASEPPGRGASLDLQRRLLLAWPPPPIRPMCLHAARLCMKHPITHEPMEWHAPTPF